MPHSWKAKLGKKKVIMSLLGVGGGTGVERAFIAVKILSVNSIPIYFYSQIGKVFQDFLTVPRLTNFNRMMLVSS